LTSSSSSGPEASGEDLVSRFVRWVVIAIAVGSLVYLVASLWAGFDKIGEELASFRWSCFFIAIGLTLVNYILRFVKWHYFIRRLGVDIPWTENAWTFVSGFSMAISPGKAGEVLKSYVIRARTGVPMATTIPAVITERLTDALAMLLLAAIGVTMHAAEQLHYVVIPTLAAFAGIGVLLHERSSLALIGLIGRLPKLEKLTPKLIEMYRAMRTCVAPISLVWTIFLSFIAWGAECVAYKVVFDGLGVDAPLDICLFLYSFATIAGSAVVPGGIGVADGALGAGALHFMPYITEGQAVASALIVRIATMWFGVGLGAFALLRVSGWLKSGNQAGSADGVSNS
jgi:glycosyltransferase 2 family protein